MITFLLSVLVLVLHVSCRSPNIVFVLVDDVGWSDVNYTSGGRSSVPTPHLDRLAAGGVRLSSHYVHPTCTPSRAALMTGRASHLRTKYQITFSILITRNIVTRGFRSLRSQHGTLIRDVSRERRGTAGGGGHHAGATEAGGLLRSYGGQVAPRLQSVESDSRGSRLPVTCRGIYVGSRELHQGWSSLTDIKILVHRPFYVY